MKVNASLVSEYGAFDVGFVMTKVNNKWFISQFPRVIHIGAAVPIWVQDSGNKAIEYKIVVDGTHLNCMLPSSGNTMNIGMPISLILVEDYVVQYQELIPKRLYRIMSSSKDFIEDAILGYIPVESSLSIYQVANGSPSFLNKGILPIGIADVTLYHSPSNENMDLVAYIDPSKMPNDVIRIVLNDSDYQGLYHKEVSISSNQGAFVKNLVDSLEYSMEAGDKLTFKYDTESGTAVYKGDNLLGSSHNRWYILPKNGGNITVNSIKRARSRDSNGTTYRGNMEISSNQEGLVIINEVNLEEYLYSVVPSEMPVKFGLESLKVQAIAARSYAVRCFKSTATQVWALMLTIVFPVKCITTLRRTLLLYRL